MSVLNGFFIALMLILLAYTTYRLFRRKGLIMLIALCAQLFALSIAVLSFFYDVQALELIQACFLLLGVMIPLFYLTHDYRKMMRKVREQGVYEGFIEPAEKENDEERNSFLPLDAFNPHIREKQAGDVIKDIDLNSEELSKNLKKCLNHAHTRLLEKDYAGAYEVYNVIIRLINNSSWLYFNHGNICSSLGKWADAVTSYKKALDLFGKGKEEKPETPDAPGVDHINAEYILHYNLGNAQFMLGKYDNAIKCFEKTIILNPAFTMAHENMAFCLTAKGDREKAVEYFRTAAAAASSSIRTHRTLAGLLIDTGRLSEAEKEINECIRLEPDGPQAYEELGRLYIRQSKLKECIEVFDKLIRLDPKSFAGYYHKAGACYKLDMKRESVECYKKALQLKDDSYKGYYNMAVALDELGERAEAVDAFKKAISLKPEFVDAYNNLGITLSTMGKQDAALEVYKEGIGRNPGIYSLFFNMGITLSEAGKHREAAAAFRSAVELKPEEYEIYYHLGASLTEMRHYNDAIEAYRAALKEKPSDSELYYNIATVYALLARYDIARDNLKQAIELNDELKSDARTNKAFDGMRGKSDFRELVS